MGWNNFGVVSDFTSHLVKTDGMPQTATWSSYTSHYIVKISVVVYLKLIIMNIKETEIVVVADNLQKNFISGMFVK